jgi:hypothetical protein
MSELQREGPAAVGSRPAAQRRPARGREADINPNLFRSEQAEVRSVHLWVPAKMTEGGWPTESGRRSAVRRRATSSCNHA